MLDHRYKALNHGPAKTTPTSRSLFLQRRIVHRPESWKHFDLHKHHGIHCDYVVQAGEIFLPVFILESKYHDQLACVLTMSLTQNLHAVCISALLCQGSICLWPKKKQLICTTVFRLKNPANGLISGVVTKSGLTLSLQVGCMSCCPGQRTQDRRSGLSLHSCAARTLSQSPTSSVVSQNKCIRA